MVLTEGANMRATTEKQKKKEATPGLSLDGASRLVSELLPLGCLSIRRQEENSLLDQERSQSRVPIIEH